MKRASSAASCSAISGPMWSRSNPPAASAAATSGRSSTTSPTRSAVCRSGTTTRPNAALPSIWKLPTAAGFSNAWRRRRTSFWKPSGQASWRSLGLDYEALRKGNSGLIMCALTPFGQTGPWRDYVSSDLLHMAAGGEMASCGYDEADVPNAPPIAPGGGNAWHMGCHFAYMAIMAALVYRTVAGTGTVYRRLDPRGLCADDRGGNRQLRLPGRGAAAPDGSPSCRRSHTPYPVPRQGRHLCLRAGGGAAQPRYVKELADLLDSYGMAGDLRTPNTRTRRSLRRTHPTSSMISSPISLPACRQRRFTTPPSNAASPGGRCAPRRRCSTTPTCTIAVSGSEVEHPELGRSFIYPGEAAIYNGSPWRISRRAPLIGEHNTEIFCDELGLSRRVSVLAENRVI